MAGDWPRAPRAYGSPQHTEPSAPVRTLPSVAELLSTRPSASSTIPAYHHRQDYFHAHSTPPSASVPPTTASSAASSYWNPVNHRQTSPPVSPTEQRPPPEAIRVYQQPVLRRQHLPKLDPTPQQSALSSSGQGASSSTVQVRQDSAIDQQRFDTGNDTPFSKSSISSSHQSQSSREDQNPASPRRNSYQPASSASTYPQPAVPHQDEPLPSQVGAQAQGRHHSKSLSSGVSSSLPYSAALPRPQEQSAERAIPVDIKSGSEPRPNITGPSSLPEHFFTQQNNFGTRQQRYNVRFAANYTSENMPPSQKPRTEPPTPPTAPAVVAEPEQSGSSPAPIPPSDEPQTPASNGSTRHLEPQPPRPAPTRESRDRGDREPSVERCVGCNEAWRRPIPDMSSGHISPAQDNAEYRRLAGNLIERLRNERKKADAAYDDWKWRHSHCYRLPSPYSTESVDDASKAAAATPPADGTTNGYTTTTANKRKSEVPHEPHSAAKQRRKSATSPAPAVRNPGSS